MMRQGIVRAADWFFENRHIVWYFRGLRWLCVVGVFIPVPHHTPIWAHVAAMAVCLYGELRDWSSRKRDYTLSLRVPLTISVMASDWVAAVIRANVSEPTHLLHSALLVEFEALFAIGLISEVLFQHSLAERTRTAPSTLPPPFVAELFLYIVLPRREREPLLGDLNEDFATNVLPK